MERLREARHRDSDDPRQPLRLSRSASVNTRALQHASGSRDLELTRTDLASILYEASQDSAEFSVRLHFDPLSQDSGGLDVTFETLLGPWSVAASADRQHGHAAGSQSSSLRNVGW
jgi:hypothetical protein